MELTQEMIQEIYSRESSARRWLSTWSGDVQDIMQDACVRIMESKKDLTTVNDPKGFAVEVLRQTCHNHVNVLLRRAELEKEHASELLAVQGDDDTHNPAEYLEAEGILRKINDLSDLHKEIAKLKFIGGFSDEAIAEMLNTSETAVSTAGTRIKKALSEDTI